jgi:phage repressor protein C with HTH and peptisase S24 domain
MLRLDAMEPLGGKLRRQRRRLGLTLDELAARTSISKPYLSLIETGRVTNPPSDEKLRRLEQVLGFTAGELISQAHLQRTPHDVRAMLQRLMAGKKAAAGAGAVNGSGAKSDGRTAVAARDLSVNLDEAYMSGILQEMVDKASSNIEAVRTAGSVPVINRVSAGYPTDFTDLSYPKGVADDYIACPGIDDKDAFAARVHGDSMHPKYTPGDVVIFSPSLAPRDGDDCFVRFEDGHTTFKRVYFETDAAGAAVIRLQPRNEKYKPQIIPADQISGMYKALFRYQRVDE